MIDESLLNYAIDYALSSGAKYAEARYQLNSKFNVIVRNNSVVGLGKYSVEGVNVRTLCNGSLGFSATNKLTREGIRDAVSKAVSRGKALSRFLKKPLVFSDEKMGSASYEVKTKKPFDSMPLEEKTRLCINIYRAANSAVKKVKVPVVFVKYLEHVEKKIVVNSDGAYVRSRTPRVYLQFNLIATHQQRGTVQRLIERGGSGGVELLDKWDPLEVARNEAKTMEKILMTAVKPPREKVEVVIGSEVVGLIVHESAGHPMEADRILGREAAQAGESYVKPEMIGEKIGGAWATVIEDPIVPGSYGYYLFDDEGVPARPRFLYKEGVINEPLHNRLTAKLFGLSSNGAARSMDYASEPIIRMSTTYLKPGDMGFDELIEDVKQGVYIKSYMEWNIDDVRWKQRYVGLESYLIVKGELKGLVRNPVLELTTRSFYSKLKGADRNLKFYAGTCGKGEPPQSIPVWFGGPNTRLSKIKLGVHA